MTDRSACGAGKSQQEAEDLSGVAGGDRRAANAPLRNGTTSEKGKALWRSIMWSADLERAR